MSKGQRIESANGACIKVMGIGGGGGNAINTMIKNEVEGVEFITANTDVQALANSLASNRIQLGKELTKGLGAGADPDIGRDATLEDRYAVQEALEGSNMVFITAGMGGGTGTGGAAIAAQIAKESGALTVGVVTKPFDFEGKRRSKLAEAGIAKLQEQVDTLITIPNQRLLQLATPDLSMVDAFKLADHVLVNAVKGISDIINISGTVNVDFADVKAVMSCMGRALMGVGSASGENRAKEAAHKAIHSPLLEDINIDGATGILINVSASESLTLHEVNQACTIVQEAAHEDANIIFGAVIDSTLEESVRVTVIATGFPVDDNSIEDFPKQSPIQQTPMTLPNSVPLVPKENILAFEQTRYLAEMTITEAQSGTTSTNELNEASNIKAEMPHSASPLTVSGATSKAEKDRDHIPASPLDLANTNPSPEELNEHAESHPPPEEDDLDIPAFLRHGIKDLSLS